jgi:hypothetical protein
MASSSVLDDLVSPVERMKLHERPERKAVVLTPQVSASRSASRLSAKSRRRSTTPLSEKPLNRTQSKAELAVEFVLSADRDERLSKPYHECGNPSMYTQQNLQKRAKLKDNNAVIDALTRFSRLFPVDNSGVITKGTYLSSHKRLARVLRPNLTDEELTQLGEEDWLQDAGDSLVLTTEKLYTILFEFADIWTQTTDPTEYLMLLDQLYIRVISV